MRHLALLPVLALAFAACAETPIPSEPETQPEQSPQFSLTASSVGYTGIDLGTLGGTYSSAWRVNIHGQVIGQSYTSTGDQHGFFWYDGNLIDLGTLGGSRTTVSALNDAGHVTGCSTTADNRTHPFLWTNGVMTDLAPGHSAAGHCWTDLNNEDQVLMTLSVLEEDGVVRSHPFVWSDGTLTDLVEEYPALVGHIGQGISNAGDMVLNRSVISNGQLEHLPIGYFGRLINNSGQAIGIQFGKVDQSIFWSDGAATEIIPLPCSMERCVKPGASAEDIDDTGVVVGGSTGQAFQWRAGVTSPLGTLGGDGSHAYAINEAGLVVGGATTTGGDWHAAMWSAGTAHDLGTVGRDYSEAYDITGDFIVGESGFNWTGQTHAVLWRRITPVDLIENLIGMVEPLEADGSLNKGQAHSLINKLNIATAMLNDGKTGPAINKIESFIHEVEAMMGGNNPVLTAEQGRPLIDAAWAAIEAIG